MSSNLTQKPELKSRVLKTELANWREFKFIQQDDFKELDKEARAKLKASILANNFTQPFYVWQDGDGIIYCLDGKHRTLMLNELLQEGYEVPYVLPATFIHCENKKDAAKLVLIYSAIYAKITQQGLFDFIELHDMKLDEFRSEINIPEFSFERFEQKFDTMDIESLADEPQQEIIPENKNIIVKPGDLFQLGRHRLLCGDCLKPADVELLMAGQKARIVFTDPPYNLKANEFTNKGNTHHEDFAIGAGEMSDNEFRDFLAKIMVVMCENTVDGSIHYICMDWRHVWHMTDAGNDVYGNYSPKQLVVWAKENYANGSFYRAQHELVFIFKNGDAKHLSHLELKDRTRSNVWSYPNAGSLASPEKSELKNHPTPKPVKMVADALLDTTNEDDLVIDFFLGSGTTLIAAEQVNRVCYATEIMPNYVQSIITRYLNFCKKNNKAPEFKHLNGNLTIKDLCQE